MSFLRHHSDLPLNKDPGTRFLPWLIAFMVYLAALSVAATAILQSITERWQHGATDTLTVQIPVADNVSDDQNRIEQTLQHLRAQPGVALAMPISRARALQLLEPWLGNVTTLDDLPLPHMIDVSLKEDSDLDSSRLLGELQQIVPDLSIDDHRIWLDRLIRMSKTLSYGAFIVVGVIALATIGTVFFVTRTGLAIHFEVIEVLHLIGAHDHYIARQFAEHALFLGLRGGFIGFLFAGPTFMGFAYLYRTIDSALLPQVDITPLQWVAVCSLPLWAAAIGYMTARFTVLRTLRKMV